MVNATQFEALDAAENVYVRDLRPVGWFDRVVERILAGELVLRSGGILAQAEWLMEHTDERGDELS
jgi:hypothetical protein